MEILWMENASYDYLGRKSVVAVCLFGRDGSTRRISLCVADANKLRRMLIGRTLTPKTGQYDLLGSLG